MTTKDTILLGALLQGLLVFGFVLFVALIVNAHEKAKNKVEQKRRKTRRK